ncbi:MAG: HAMP domain-containing protein [Salinarimonas sp.]|nr:HAMP domain-containing protein [Salinarimonas sp.]
MRARIAAGFAAILLLSVGMAGFAIFNALGLNRDFAEYRSIAGETQGTETLAADFTRMLVLARDELATPDEERRERLNALSNAVRAQIFEATQAASSDDRRRMLTDIVMTYDEFERGIDGLFSMDAELRGIVADEVEPAMGSVTEAVWQLVYSASLEGDLDTSNEGSRALQFALISQAAFARNLAGDEDSRRQAEMTGGRALNLAKELYEGTTHAARKNWLAQIVENLEIYNASMMRGMEVSDELAIMRAEVLGESEQIIAGLATDIVSSASQDAQAIGEGTAAAAMQVVMMTIAATVLLAVLGIAVAVLIGRSVSRPVVAMTTAMRELAEGNTAITVPGRERSDEIGAMAGAVEVFRQNAIERERLTSESEKEQLQRAERQRAVEALITEFRDSVGTMLEGVTGNMQQMRDTAHNLTMIASQTADLTEQTATASEDSSSNAATAAEAAESLNGAINEIARAVGMTTEVVGRATQAADHTNTRVASLSDAAQRIGDVIGLIQEIAEQTNLLALNATIEAARAGEAGKGFAVVAAEVKNLADQTAKATQEISEQIGAIQGSTKDAVSNIEQIAGIMKEVSEHTTSIAAAVEEQGASTDEITRNVQRSAESSRQVAGNIESVKASTDETNRSADHVLHSADAATDETQKLRRAIDTFLERVAAA